jgi:hypothetical protein
VFPKYVFQPSDVGWPQRLRGLRDAPWKDVSFVLGELVYNTREQLHLWLRTPRSGPGDAGAGTKPSQPAWPNS